MAADAKLVEDVNGDPMLYRSRFYVAAVFSCFALLQGGLWAIPGSLSSAYTSLYGVNGDTIQLLINYGPIFYLPFALPFALWMDRPGGMRSTVLLSHALVTAGAALRVVAGARVLDNPACVAIIHASYVLNGIAGPVAMGAVGKLSELWFPVKSRGTATAVMCEANESGAVFAFLVGPAMVPTGTLLQLQSFNYLCLALCLVVLVALVGSFPSQPPTPPSRTALEIRERDAQGGLTLPAFKTVLRNLLRNRSFLVLICAYGFSTGMFGSWATMVSVILPSFSATLAGYLSFASTVGGNVGGVLLGRVLDRYRHLGPKRMLVCLLSLAACAFMAFACLCALTDTSSYTTVVLLFVTGAVGGFAINSSLPLFFELSMEVSHPEPEATVVVVLTVMNNVGCLLFLSLPVDQDGSGWMNWLFAGTLVVFVCALAVGYDDVSLRYDVDKHAGVVGQDGGEGEQVGVEGQGESPSAALLA